jgi:catecholate siderophore receptor
MNGTVKASDVSYEVGQQLAYVPHVSLNLWSTYRLSNGLMLGGGANYEDGHYFNQSGGFLFVGGGTLPQTRYVANAAAVQALTKYLVFNAVASYQLNKHLQLQVNGKNLGNDRYADLAYDRHFLPGPTRQVLVTPIISW